MANVSLRPEVYNRAALFAKRDRVNVDEWVNKVLLSIIVENPNKEEKQLAGHKMFSWDELGGIFASDKSDKELLDDYLDEKYGV